MAYTSGLWYTELKHMDIIIQQLMALIESYLVINTVILSYTLVERMSLYSFNSVHNDSTLRGPCYISEVKHVISN